MATASSLISTEQAASVVGVTTPTIARWVRRGLITPVIKGRRAVGNDAHSHWFDLQDVLALQRPHRAKPTRTVRPDDLVTKRQIQELLSIGPVKLWKLVKAGKLEVVTRGGSGQGKGRTAFYRLSDVRRVAEEYGLAPTGEDINLVTLFEAGAALGINESTLRLWKSKGWISPVTRERKRILVNKYDLEKLRAFADSHRHGKGDETSDDAVLSAYKAEKATGISRYSIRLWVEAGILKPVRTTSTGAYFRLGDVRELKKRTTESDDDEYVTNHRAYYDEMSDELRRIVDAIAASCKADEDSETIFAEAVATVIAGMNCKATCCEGLNEAQRIDHLKRFNEVCVPEPVYSNSNYTNNAADDADEPHSMRLDRQERANWRKQQNELFWLRLSGQYRRWDREYSLRLRQAYQIAN